MGYRVLFALSDIKMQQVQEDRRSVHWERERERGPFTKYHQFCKSCPAAPKEGYVTAKVELCIQVGDEGDASRSCTYPCRHGQCGG